MQVQALPNGSKNLGRSFLFPNGSKNLGRSFLANLGLGGADNFKFLLFD